MALGDGIVAAIAFVREYLPLRVISTCGGISWWYAEIKCRVDLGRVLANAELRSGNLESCDLAVLGILRSSAPLG